VEQCTSETEDKIGMDLQQLNLSYLDLVGVLVQDIASVELFGFGFICPRFWCISHHALEMMEVQTAQQKALAMRPRMVAPIRNPVT